MSAFPTLVFCERTYPLRGDVASRGSIGHGRGSPGLRLRFPFPLSIRPKSLAGRLCSSKHNGAVSGERRV
jgi:hypothetical protein